MAVKILIKSIIVKVVNFLKLRNKIFRSFCCCYNKLYAHFHLDITFEPVVVGTIANITFKEFLI